MELLVEQPCNSLDNSSSRVRGLEVIVCLQNVATVAPESWGDAGDHDLPTSLVLEKECGRCFQLQLHGRNGRLARFVGSTARIDKEQLATVKPGGYFAANFALSRQSDDQ